ncbi:MAG: patatin-like phospholipase family protein [Elainella sp. Prado103]|nr:patatin-like phospholipase family protein [Elainella sp. Prado103]
MAQKLAIAISGAVSLGSYEAGVLYEVIEAIAQHNVHPDTSVDHRIEIDVITGTSAGALTACILAQKLMFEAEALRQPYANALYGAWVEDLGIAELLQLRGRDDPKFSIFSSEQIADLGYKYLLQRYAIGQPTPRQRHPAVAPRLKLGLGLSHLNGVDQEIEMTDFPDLTHLEYRSNRHFRYTRYADRFTCEICDHEMDDEPALWKTLERIARASGTLPFAFRLLQLQPWSDDSIPRKSTLPQDPPGSFGYLDSGLFEHEPLGLAKTLVDEIDPQHLDHADRFYLSVAPAAHNVHLPIRPDTATYLNLGAALANAIRAQAGWQDWLATGQMNAAIRQFEQQSKHLSDVLLKTPRLRLAFSQVADPLLTALYASALDSPQSEQGAEVAMQQDRSRLRQQFTEEYDRLVYGAEKKGEPGDAVAESWLKLVQALEKAQNLGDRDVMTVYAITSAGVELAGEQFFALGGFLDQSFRESDYDWGRRQAVDFLEKLQLLHGQGRGEGQLYLTNFVPGHNLDPAAPLSGRLDLSRVPLQTRQLIKAQLIDRLQHGVDAIESRFWVRWLLKFSLRLVLAKRLNQLLKL